MGYPNRRRQNELLDKLKPKTVVCDCCKRDVHMNRASFWSGDGRICRDCIDEMWKVTDKAPNDWIMKANDFVEIGNRVRAKHNLPPLDG